jgi:hypothetical protein
MTDCNEAPKGVLRRTVSTKRVPIPLRDLVDDRRLLAIEEQEAADLVFGPENTPSDR